MNLFRALGAGVRQLESDGRREPYAAFQDRRWRDSPFQCRRGSGDWRRFDGGREWRRSLAAI